MCDTRTVLYLRPHQVGRAINWQFEVMYIVCGNETVLIRTLMFTQ